MSAVLKNKKSPIDIKIIGSLYVIGALATLFLSSFPILIGVPKIELDIILHQDSILGGLIRFDNLTPYGIYYFFLSIYLYICGNSTFRMKKYAWWLLLIERAYTFFSIGCTYVLDGMGYIVIPDVGVFNIHYLKFSLSTSIIFIVWLWWRRNLFGINLGKKQENNRDT